jgi:hypothetical protein
MSVCLLSFYQRKVKEQSAEVLDKDNKKIMCIVPEQSCVHGGWESGKVNTSFRSKSKHTRSWE